MSAPKALWWRQSIWELGLNLRNGEQLLLVVVIPVAVFIAATTTSLLPSLASSPARALGTVLTISVLASAFTSVAISTAFERRSGALLYMSTTPLGRLDVVSAKVIATLMTVVISCVAVLVAALALEPGEITKSAGSFLLTLAMVILGTTVCASWALFLASTVRAEAVLALANALFVVFLLFGGVLVPLDQLPSVWADVAGFFFPGALAEVLVSSVETGGVSLRPVIVVALWAAAGITLSVRAFRWR